MIAKLNPFELILPYLQEIEPLILDPEISEIMVNGARKVFIEKSGVLIPVGGIDMRESQLERAVINIARNLNDDFGQHKPILDARLPDGSRVAAVMPPVSVNGLTLTIRKFSGKFLSLDDLIEMGTLTPELAAQLATSIYDRETILISGGTGTGKTTTLNLLCGFLPPEERIVLIEDTSEIAIKQDNLVRFEAKTEPLVTIRDLLKHSLRHRPDRIILGEVRGGEAFDLLQLMNTGHKGTLCTLHANSAKEALSRFVSLALQAGVDLPYKAIKSSMADSINLLLHIERQGAQRKMTHLLRVTGYDYDKDVFQWEVLYAG